MPRKKIIYSPDLAYHIVARTNNKEWFPLPLDDCWEIFSTRLKEAHEKYFLNIHCFVLMNNHYHLICSTKDKYLLGFIMNWFQTNITKSINKKAVRQNHLFGGHYKACMIDNPYYYAHATKYVYQNPLIAKMSKTVESYGYSTAATKLLNKKHEIPINPCAPNGIDHLVSSFDVKEKLKWLNEIYSEKDRSAISKALYRTQFKIPNNKSNKAHRLTNSLS